MKTPQRLFSLFFGSFVIELMILAASAGVSTAQTGSSAGDTSRAKLSESVFGLGVNFSPLSGAGLSVRQHFIAKISYMVDGYFARTEAGTDYSYGLELQYDLILKDRIRFYILGGTSYFYDDSPNPPPQYHRGDTILTKPYSNTYLGPLRIGGGFGIETNLIGDDFCILGDLVFISYQPIGDFQPYGSVGLHYYFR
jgi:hypothetical protein